MRMVSPRAAFTSSTTTRAMSARFTQKYSELIRSGYLEGSRMLTVSWPFLMS